MCMKSGNLQQTMPYLEQSIELLDRYKLSTVSKTFKINLEDQNYVHFEVILSNNVQIFGIMASL